MCKRVLTIAAILFVISGLAVAANTATITQVGSDNQADITQQDENNSHTATITQNGNENQATIDQTADAWGAGANATITQTGNLNYAESLVRNGYHAYVDAVITQTGNENIAIQNFTPGTAWNSTDGTILQDGFSNEAYQTWGYIGTDYSSKLDATQIGDDNYAEQKSGRNGNDGDVYQEGDLNYAYQDLGGRTNIADTSQIGDQNWAEIHQLGNSNVATQSQTGDLHSSIITQTGNGNTANVVQGP